jgi:tetratricopeptide (TPR) repeat protein
LLDLGRNDEALAALEPLLGGGRTLLATLSETLAGRAEEAKKNFQKAADHYAAAASGAAKDFPVEIALMGQARCLDALGKKEEAISAYQKVVDAYPDSPFAAKAGEKIQSLKG